MSSLSVSVVKDKLKLTYHCRRAWSLPINRHYDYLILLSFFFKSELIESGCNFLFILLPPQGFGPDGQNPRRHPRGPCVLGRKISQYQKKSRFFKNRARKVLPKSSQGIAETSLGVEETLEGVWERSLGTRF